MCLCATFQTLGDELMRKILQKWKWKGGSREGGQCLTWRSLYCESTTLLHEMHVKHILWYLTLLGPSRASAK